MTFDVESLRENPQFVVPDKDFEQPKLKGTVEGWRAWKVDRKLPRYGNALKLRSVTFGAGVMAGWWPPKQAMPAHCDFGCKEVPGITCGCGLYSAASPEGLISAGYAFYADEHRFCVIGQVANWGRVIPGTEGWISQYSYPVKLFVPYEFPRHALELKKAYGCHVQLFNFLRPYAEIDWETLHGKIGPERRR